MASLLTRALVSGTVAGIATAVIASLAGRRTAGSYAAPLNATSHVVWGDPAAASRNDFSLKHTASGFALNHGACIFWALFYEWFAGPYPSKGRAAASSAAVAAAAYVTDYHVVPQRLTPGFELRLPGKALASIYAALALGLCAKGVVLFSKRSDPRRSRPTQTMTGFAAHPDTRQIIRQAESDLEHGLVDTDAGRRVVESSYAERPGGGSCSGTGDGESGRGGSWIGSWPGMGGRSGGAFGAGGVSGIS